VPLPPKDAAARVSFSDELLMTADLRAELEAAIAADPDARDNYLVYGDWLESIGDPRGALVAIGAELAKDPDNSVMRASHVQHLADHRREILGGLADWDDVMTEVEWFMGFIRKCRIATPYERFIDRPDAPMVKVMRWLVEEPGPGRFLQDLDVGIVHMSSYAPVTEVLAQRPRPTLRRLVYGDHERTRNGLGNRSHLGDCARLWPMVPNLVELTLGGFMVIGPIDLPRLEALTMVADSLDGDSLGHLGRASWPSLVRLSLQIGHSSGSAAALAPLLRSDRAPKLRRLGLRKCLFTEELCRVLVESPLLAQLEELDLSMGGMSDDGARVLAEHAERLSHLAVLDVGDSPFTHEARALLRGIARRVIFDEPHDDEDDPVHRYGPGIL
jgi:uncharacterized protein (TIGR02996 family)